MTGLEGRIGPVKLEEPLAEIIDHQSKLRWIRAGCTIAVVVCGSSPSFMQKCRSAEVQKPRTVTLDQ